MFYFLRSWLLRLSTKCYFSDLLNIFKPNIVLSLLWSWVFLFTNVAVIVYDRLQGSSKYKHSLLNTSVDNFMCINPLGTGIFFFSNFSMEIRIQLSSLVDKYLFLTKFAIRKKNSKICKRSVVMSKKHDSLRHYRSFTQAS